MIRVHPPVVALTAALAQRLIAGTSSAPGPGRAVAAVTLTLASFSLAGAAASGFRRVGTTLEPHHPDQASALVTTGVNTISRNPMYAGLAGLLVAHAVWHGSWVALAPVAGFVLYIDRVQIEAEEAALTKRFGADYDAYRAAVPRWLDRRSLSRP